MTRLRKLMPDELQRRNYAQNTVRAYIHAIEDFAKYFHRSPDRLGPEHIREYQVHLFRDCKLSAGTIEGRTAALRFLFVKTLKRPYLPDHIPFPKRQRRMPTVLSQEEVARLMRVLIWREIDFLFTGEKGIFQIGILKDVLISRECCTR